MSLYKQLYFGLFNAITDALAAMENQNYGTAREILMEAQCKAEEDYINQAPDEEA